MVVEQKAFYKFNEVNMSDNEQIAWSDEYIVGIKNIDSQHKKLFKLVNKLYDLKENETTKEDIRTILYDFKNYMQTHFDEEEDYMNSIGYDKLEIHKKQHQEIIDQLAKIIKIPAKLNILKAKIKIAAKRGLINHIIKEDTKIKLFHTDRKIDERNITNLLEE